MKINYKDYIFDLKENQAPKCYKDDRYLFPVGKHNPSDDYRLWKCPYCDDVIKTKVVKA